MAGESVNPPSSNRLAILPAALLLTGMAGIFSQLRADDYGAWAAGWFTSAERAAGMAAPRQDPDADGWANLLECLVGSNPRAAGSQPIVEFYTDGAATPEACCGVATGPLPAGLRILVSDDLVHWSPASCCELTGDGWLVTPLACGRFIRLEAFALPGVTLDSDGDGLHDLFEEQLVASDPLGALEHIGDVAPDDDADGDGVANIDEPENRHPSGSGYARPPLLDPLAVANAADRATPPTAESLTVHTPLR